MSQLRRSGLYTTAVSQYLIELRLDVDGDFPQNQVSVSLIGATPIHLIAEVTRLAEDQWQGPIWYRFPEGAGFPFSGQEPDQIRVAWLHDVDEMLVVCSFLQEGRTLAEFCLNRQSGAFRELELELDTEQGVEAVTRLNLLPFRETTQDPGRDLVEVGQVFAETGLNVRYTTEADLVPAHEAGANRAWSAAELNDVMIDAWSRSKNPAWSIWAFSAGRFEDATGRFTFGIMFDINGEHQRNGCAVFHKTIDTYYARRSLAERNRIKFRTLIHEIGHSLNLAHSWQKTLGRRWHAGVANDRFDAGFMNYPRFYADGGENGYWRDFQYRFSDQELVFLRHAPEAFVKPSGAAWFAAHGARTMDPTSLPTVQERRFLTRDFSLTLRVHRSATVFEFMEDARVELKLTNHSRHTRLVPVDALDGNHHLQVAVTRLGGRAQPVKPFYQTCHQAELLALAPGDSFYASLPIARGVGGWVIDEPGDYRAVVSLDFVCASIEGEPLPVHLDAALDFRVVPPHYSRRREAYRLAQDYFHEDVARTYAVGGTRLLVHVNDLFAEMRGRFPAANAATQARWAAAAPLIQPFQTLEWVDGQRRLSVKNRDLDLAQEVVTALLADEAGIKAAGALGHIDFGAMCLKLKDQFEEEGRFKEATACCGHFEDALTRRGVSMPARLSAGLRKIRAQLMVSDKATS